MTSDMGSLDFIVEISKAWAWPITTVFIAYNFKNDFSKLIPRLRKLKHKETELEFAEGVSEIIKENKKNGSSIEPLFLEKSPLQKEYDALIRLAEISPRAAIVEAYRTVEMAAMSVINMQDTTTHPYHSITSLRQKVLDDQAYAQLQKLKELRNKAAHSEDFNLMGMPIESYIELSLSLANKINLYKENL